MSAKHHSYTGVDTIIFDSEISLLTLLGYSSSISPIDFEGCQIPASSITMFTSIGGGFLTTSPLN